MISVHEAEKLSLKQIERFLAAAKQVRFEAKQRKEVYGWIERLLCEQEYTRQGRQERGLLRRYIAKMTGLSRAQITRLLARYVATGQVRVKDAQRHRFPQRYTRADIELLAKVDEAHEGLSGPATRRILQREFRLSNQSLSAWLGSRTDTSTTCAAMRSIANGAGITRRHGLRRYPSASAVGLIHKADPAICG